MKKLSHIFAGGVLAVLALLGTACDFTDFGDTNVNPNATEVPITSALLTNTLAQMGIYPSETLPGLYAQYYSETQYTDNSLYAVPIRDWSGDYATRLYDLQNIINLNSDPETAEEVSGNGSNNNQIAVARILKAYIYANLVDRYGDAPYSQALKGEGQTAYDPGADVYQGIFNELSEAVAQFDNGLPVKGDVLFGGDNAKWKKFANSLHLILALRIHDANANLACTEAQRAIGSSGGLIESNSDNATLSYPGAPFDNPWYALYNGRKDFSISDVITDKLYELNDPRIDAYGEPNASGVVVSVPYGLTRDDAIAYTAAHPDWSRVLNSEFRQNNSDLVLLSAAATYLARAEAAQLGCTSENAGTMYQMGLKASFEQWGVFDQAGYDAYIAQPAVSIASGDALTKIRLQRWLTFYPDGFQGWNEWRRTGVPTLVPSPNATNSSGQIPRRYPYPVPEATLNKANYDAAVSRMGGDTEMEHVWWDK